MRAKADGNDTTDNPIPSAAFEAVGMIGTEVANGILASSVKPAQKAGHMTGAPDRKSACCNAENILTHGCRPHMKEGEEGRAAGAEPRKFAQGS